MSFPQDSVGFVEKQYFTFAEPPNEVVLDSNQKLGPITLAYETYGKLNEEKNNAILICHALSGSAHAAGLHKETDKNPGWWDNAIGPGKMFDTTQYFVICPNVVGGCKGSTGPSSINPHNQKPYSLDFPIITINDMVQIQKCLIEYLEIKRLKAVVGGSMGGMQALVWSINFPDIVEKAIVIAACARLSTIGIALNAAGRHAITTDPDWNNGDYYNSKYPEKGLAVARMIGHISYLSDEIMHHKFGRRLQNKEDYSYDFSDEFEIESYLTYQGKKFVERFDANSYLYITKAMDYFDLEKEYGSLEDAFKNLKNDHIIISFTSDWLFPTYQSKEIADTLIRLGKDVTFIELESNYGHDAFLVEAAKMHDILSFFLQK